MNCRHCLVKPVNRSRGLCWTCYYTPGVREQYPPKICPTNRAGEGVMNQERKLGEPTQALPGSEEKIRVLERRAAEGEVLFHPEDFVDVEHKKAGVPKDGRKVEGEKPTYAAHPHSWAGSGGSGPDDSDA